MNPKLSILICTLPKRHEIFMQLVASINIQAYLCANVRKIQIIYDRDIFITVGAKRNHLLSKATGEYIVFIDDDDRIEPFYVNELLEAINTGADAICFQVAYHHNGAPPKPVYYDKDFKRDINEKDCYKRIPNHLMCVKRELALQAGFPDVSFGEDAEYSKRLLPLIKTQHIIPKTLYHYQFNSLTSETQRK